MQIYLYDSNFIYIGSEQADLDPMESQIQGQNVYMLPGNSTFVAPVSYDPTLQYLQFDPVNQTWIIKDSQINGNYYLKTDGSLHTTINIKDEALYTQTPITLTTGDVVHFDSTTSTWIYDTEGAATLAANLAVAKQNKLSELDIIYANSQDCVIITGETDSNNNIPIIGKIIMRSNDSGGQLDLLSRQKDLASDYGVSFIQVDGCKLENGIYVKTGIIYAGYFLKEEWKKFYVEILNKSSKNYVTRGKLRNLVNSIPNIQTLNYIASILSSYFTIPFIIDLTTKINRVPTDITQGDAIFVENLQSNLEKIESRINEIMLALN